MTSDTGMVDLNKIFAMALIRMLCSYLFVKLACFGNQYDRLDAVL